MRFRIDVSYQLQKPDNFSFLGGKKNDKICPLCFMSLSLHTSKDSVSEKVKRLLMRMKIVERYLLVFVAQEVK